MDKESGGDVKGLGGEEERERGRERGEGEGEKKAGCEERADLSMCFGKGVQFNFQVIAL